MKELNNADKMQLEVNETGKCTIRIEPNFAGDYSLEYDGKYVTLLGKDSGFEVPQYGGIVSKEIEYEERVLISCVAEKRYAIPKIISVTDTEIIIDFGTKKIKPCPFCGCQAELTLRGNEFTKKRSAEIECTSCHTKQITSALDRELSWCEAKAIYKWNSRF